MFTARVLRAAPLVAPGRLAGVGWKAVAPPSPRTWPGTAPHERPLCYQGARVIARHRKSWTGVSATLAEIRCDGPLHVDLSAASTMLSVVLEEVGGRFETRARSWCGRPADDHGARPLSLIPAGLEADGRATGIRFLRHLVLQLDVHRLARMLEDEIDVDDALVPRMMFLDAGVMHLAQLFAEECESDAPHSRLYGDNLSMALMLALSRLSGSAERSVKTGRLAPWQIRRVTDYFSAHLADDIQLQTVSDLVNLSRSYFSRAFKLSTGRAPHQWLLQARIAKAKQLLLEGDLPLARIAVELGFADQAHFTRTFGRVAGQSPRAWQRALRA